MVTLAVAARIASRLPDVEIGARYGNRTWFVGGKAFAWERPFSKADRRRYGSAPVPTGPILGVRVDGLQHKQAVLDRGERGVFTIPHFDGYPAVLIQLGTVSLPVLRRLLQDAWLGCGPQVVATAARARTRRRRTPAGGSRQPAR